MIKHIDINKVNGSTTIVKGVPCFSIAVMYQFDKLYYTYICLN